MGQLAEALRRDPKNQTLFRTEGGRFEYGDPVHMIQDLVVTRRTWPDATILANDNPISWTYGYLAFWEPDTPTLGFILPRQAVSDCPSGHVRALFTNQNRPLLNLVERVGAKGFDTRIVDTRIEDTRIDTRRSSWDRLMQDDEPL